MATFNPTIQLGCSPCQCAVAAASVNSWKHVSNVACATYPIRYRDSNPHSLFRLADQFKRPQIPKRSSWRPTTMASGFTFLALLAILLAAYYELSLKAVLSGFGVWRKIEPVGNANCKKVEALQACESTSRPSGFIFDLVTRLHSPQRSCCTHPAACFILPARRQQNAGAGSQLWGSLTRTGWLSTIT